MPKALAKNVRLNSRRDLQLAWVLSENIDRIRTMRGLSLRDLSKLTGDSKAPSPGSATSTPDASTSRGSAWSTASPRP